MSTPLGAEANKSLFRDSSNVIVLNYSTLKNHYQNRELPSLGMDATFHSRRPVGASARAAFTDTGRQPLSPPCEPRSITLLEAELCKSWWYL